MVAGQLELWRLRGRQNPAQLVHKGVHLGEVGLVEYDDSVQPRGGLLKRLFGG